MKIPDSLDKTRLDVALTTLLKTTRSQIKKLIEHDCIFVNGSLPKKSGDIVHTGDSIDIHEQAQAETLEHQIEQSVDTTIIPDILRETDTYIVINKPSGLLTHPTQANELWSVSHWIWQQYPALKTIGEYPNRPGIVHRLDKETSGVMVIAKTQPMFEALKMQFKDRTVDKQYTALVHGIIERDTDIINFDIGRGHDGKMVARPKTDTLLLKNVGKHQQGKVATTEFFVTKRFSRYTLLDIHIYSGRTHQIRVHMFAYNHPVVGDPLYTQQKINKKLDTKIGRLFLHANTLTFTDLNGISITTVAPLPEKLTEIIETLS
jgi:23S rRNA pseudouridine1911/1915/1917 synthase